MNQQMNRLKNSKTEDNYSFLAKKDDLSTDETFFIAIQLRNQKYIYEWFNSKQNSNGLYSFVKEYETGNFNLYDRDTDKIVKPATQLSKTLSVINVGNARTRFVLQVR